MNIDNLTPIELEEKFQKFLLNIDGYIENLRSKAENENLKLDMSLNSLNDLETYSSKTNIAVDIDHYTDVAAYLGELVRKEFGGKWICCLDKENNPAYYGFPVIEGHAPEGVLFAPFFVVEAFLLREKKSLFLNAIKIQVGANRIDWSKF
ncbi:hypothetical protein [Chryseobacterium sp. c4a]|uniref:hypothetical protein n=1 Tax=Chryseobacterium sp. c4a TaxID=1573582 RepID=UPI001357D3A7|nr:hypothetical protein [Chryseobacterium sp. c4a]